jgi:hypothetical protein
MTMDIEGILARYGLDIRDCPDRANLIAMYRSIERLEEQCFAMQQDIRRLNHEIYCLQESSSHATNLAGSPDAGPEGRRAPREDFTPGAI